ncbi:MAG: DNA recombination protein RmuC [Candidatus Omnitrophica bacterium]|nr:DNA recombination protein RmuC [Candidatus Omnitrophota bacterium]
MPLVEIGLFVVMGFLAVAVFILLTQNARLSELIRSQRDEARARDTSVAVGEEARRASLEGAVRSLEDKLRVYDTLLREWEKDRAQKFGQLANELQGASKATLRLQETTQALASTLSNNKLRGQWGERMAEDIIRYAGLLENINYRKQVAQASSGTRPDFIFLLPDERVINMDVKFPLNNYLSMVNAPSPAEHDAAEKEFFKNVRARIKELRGREYINTAENTLDFVLLFIPNEQVFGFIQEKCPEIMDEALKDKVVLCSPFTLYAVLSIIRQAHEHFRFEKDIRKILGHIDIFAKHFDTFKARFIEFGEIIVKLQGKYSDLRDTSFKNIETKIRHIEEHKRGAPGAGENDLPEAS